MTFLKEYFFVQNNTVEEGVNFKTYSTSGPGAFSRNIMNQYLDKNPELQQCSDNRPGYSGFVEYLTLKLLGQKKSVNSETYLTLKIIWL